jgi:hypothetical protein
MDKLTAIFKAAVIVVMAGVLMVIIYWLSLIVLPLIILGIIGFFAYVAQL